MAPGPAPSTRGSRPFIVARNMDHFRFRPQIAIAMLGLALVLGVLALGSAGASPGQVHPPATYVEAMVGAPHLVNPLLASSETDIDLAHLVYSGLTRVDSTGNIAPDLASAWQVSPDSR